MNKIHGAKAIETAQRGDEESNPISRSTSPLPSPDLTTTSRGGHYSYTNLPNTDEPGNHTGPADGGGDGNAARGNRELKVPQSRDGGPVLGRRRSSGLSDVVRTR